MKRVLPFAAVAASLVVLGYSPPSVSSTAGSATQAQAMQLLADVTLIDSECRNLNAVFGMAFRYAEERGIHMTDVMPMGARRAEFQAAYDRRLEATAHEDLCGSLARQYDEEFPGLFTLR